MSEVEKKRDIILVMGWWSMTGVFGAGVVSTLEEMDIYDRIHSIYGISAGAHNAAYFLARDTKRWSSIYYEELLDGFIDMKNGPKLFGQLVKNVFQKQETFDALVHIDYLIDVEKNKKKLDLQAIIDSEIPFYAKVFDVEKEEGVYIDVKKDVMGTLHATAALAPFYPQLVEVDGRKYTDSFTCTSFVSDELLDVIENNKDKVVIFVFNTPELWRPIGWTMLFSLLWGVLLSLFLRRWIVWKKMKNVVGSWRAFRSLVWRSNVHVLQSDELISLNCEDEEKVRRLYRHGQNKTKRFMQKFLVD